MQKHVDTPRPDQPALTGRARTIALLVVLLAFFMDVLDGTIVNVAIPSIQEGLGASYSAIQWIIAGYALAFALFLITGGRLGDILGYKKLFLAGIVGFTAASAFCGSSTTTEMLVGGRLVQGFMAAMMVPQILSTIQIMYTTFEERRGRLRVLWRPRRASPPSPGRSSARCSSPAISGGSAGARSSSSTCRSAIGRDHPRGDLPAGCEVAASAASRSRRRRAGARRDAAC